MNDDAVELQSRRETIWIRAIELTVLGTVAAVSVGGFIAFCVLVWPALNLHPWSLFNPSKWNHDWVGAIGTWFGGIATAVAIWFSVKVARKAQATSMEALRAEIAEESRREQRQAVRDVWVRIRAEREAVEKFSDLWHDYASKLRARDNAADPKKGGLKSPENRYNSALWALRTYQPEALALGALAKDAFLEPMLIVTDEEVRPVLERLRKDFLQLNAFIEHCYANLGNVPPLFDSSGEEMLVLTQIQHAITKHSDQLIRCAQDRLSQPLLPMLE